MYGARGRVTCGGALSSGPSIRLSGSLGIPAAINKRDETRRAQNGTTVAMSRGMHRLLSNGRRDDDDEDDEKDEKSLNAPSKTRALIPV